VFEHEQPNRHVKPTISEWKASIVRQLPVSFLVHGCGRGEQVDTRRLCNFIPVRQIRRVAATDVEKLSSTISGDLLDELPAKNQRAVE
jgi:hypothetical protein